MFVRRYRGFSLAQQGAIEAACEGMQQRAVRTLDDGTPIAAWFGTADRPTGRPNGTKAISPDYG